MAESFLDLWTPRYPESRLHPHFRGLAAAKRDAECITRWTIGFVDANGNVVDEFQTKFSPAFWEFYLHAMFKSLGFKPTRPAERPDFIVEAPQGRIAVEAKVTEAGPTQVPEWTPKQDVPYDREAFCAQTSAKLCGAMASKLKSYRTYENEPHVKGIPFLLCVSPFDHPWFINQGFRAITRVLYQYDEPIGEIDQTGKLIEIGHRRIESFVTANGTVVPFGCFLDSTYAEVSGVFFNPRATISKLMIDPLRASHEKERIFASWYMVSTGKLYPQDIHPSLYRETLADGGYLLLNPFARHAVDAEPFFKQGVTICRFDAKARVLDSKTPEPFLKERTTRRVLPDDYPRDLLGGCPEETRCILIVNVQ